MKKISFFILLLFSFFLSTTKVSAFIIIDPNCKVEGDCVQPGLFCNKGAGCPTCNSGTDKCCPTADDWTKNKVDSCHIAGEWRASPIDPDNNIWYAWCVITFTQTTSQVCSTGDKCNSGETHLHSGNCDCSIGGAYKYCCTAAGVAEECLAYASGSQSDGIPPPEGQCPGGYLINGTTVRDSPCVPTETCPSNGGFCYTDPVASTCAGYHTAYPQFDYESITGTCNNGGVCCKKTACPAAVTCNSSNAGDTVANGNCGTKVCPACPTGSSCYDIVTNGGANCGSGKELVSGNCGKNSLGHDTFCCKACPVAVTCNADNCGDTVANGTCGTKVCPACVNCKDLAKCNTTACGATSGDWLCDCGGNNTAGINDASRVCTSKVLYNKCNIPKDGTCSQTSSYYDPNVYGNSGTAPNGTPICRSCTDCSCTPGCTPNGTVTCSPDCPTACGLGASTISTCTDLCGGATTKSCPATAACGCTPTNPNCASTTCTGNTCWDGCNDKNGTKSCPITPPACIPWTCSAVAGQCGSGLNQCLSAPGGKTGASLSGHYYSWTCFGSR